MSCIMPCILSLIVVLGILARAMAEEPEVIVVENRAFRMEVVRFPAPHIRQLVHKASGISGVVRRGRLPPAIGRRLSPAVERRITTQRVHFGTGPAGGPVRGTGSGRASVVMIHQRW